MKNKIILAFLVLTLAIGIAAADDLDLNSIKVPDSYKIIDDDEFYSATSDLRISIDEFELDDINEKNLDIEDILENNPFKNDTALNYTVSQGDLNNTLNFTCDEYEMYGCVELVEINGEKYTVSVWASNENGAEIISNATHILEKINQLNSLNPIDTAKFQ